MTATQINLLREHSTINPYDLVRDIPCLDPIRGFSVSLAFPTYNLEWSGKALGLRMYSCSQYVSRDPGCEIDLRRGGVLNNTHIQSTVSATSSGVPSTPIGISTPHQPCTHESQHHQPITTYSSPAPPDSPATSSSPESTPAQPHSP